MKIKNPKKYYIYHNNIINIQKAYENYDIGYFGYKFSLFMNWLKFKINEFRCKP